MRIELETDRFYLSRHYSEALEAAGASPVHISLIPREDYIRSVMNEVDGVLLPGSDSDVDPLRYGEEPHPLLGSVHPIKDEVDALVLALAERRAVPLLAICFGMQILNVQRGGKLIQDIRSSLPEAIKHQQGAPRERHSHRVRLLEGSLLSQLAQSDQALVNSHHHQAISAVGSDLVATAWSADGLVEALADTRLDRFVLAVQWHPEIAWERDDLSRKIFARFVEAARDDARARRRESGLLSEGAGRVR